MRDVTIARLLTLGAAAAVLAGAAPARAGTAVPPVRWRTAAPGLERAELALDDAAVARGLGLARTPRVRLVLIRLDPARHTVRLDAAVEPDGRLSPWHVGRAPAAAVLAMNAGQYTDEGPWGWVVHHGRELQAPGSGALASALVATRDGRVRVLDRVELDSARATGGVAEALQSYPALLVGEGELPGELRAGGAGVDLEHRDGRLAVCELRDGRLLVALTRWATTGGAGRLGAVPVGLTVPEMAAAMGALDCRRALLLDGGLSAQLRVRSASGGTEEWPGLRRVPVGVVAVARAAADTALAARPR